MKYARFGESGLVVSRLTLGAMTFGSGETWGFRFTVDQKAADSIVGRAIDAGVNFFDTSDVYAFGKSEEILGRALGNRRKDVVVATKVGGRMSDALTDAGLGFRHILSAAEASLRRLNTDYIDLYQVHFDDRITPLEETLRALDNLQKRGLVRYTGFSNYPAWKAAEALGLQREHGYAPFVSAQVYYSLVGRDIEHEIAPFARHAGIGIMVWSPLAGGFLSGKYTREDPEGGGGRLAAFNFPPVDRELGYKVVDTLKKTADTHAATVAQTALAWVLSKPYVTSVILGVTGLKQLDENLQTVNVQLSVEELAGLDQAASPPLLYPGWMYARPADPAVEKALQNGY
jgi:aryl-alcohol dehydrogenase-like predicted oxidoreductase